MRCQLKEGVDYIQTGHRKIYSAEIKQFLTTEALACRNAARVARKYGLPPATVKDWVYQGTRPRPLQLPPTRHPTGCSQVLYEWPRALELDDLIKEIELMKLRVRIYPRKYIVRMGW
jgi:transposase-like protein